MHITVMTADIREVLATAPDPCDAFSVLPAVTVFVHTGIILVVAITLVIVATSVAVTTLVVVTCTVVGVGSGRSTVCSK